MEIKSDCSCLKTGTFCSIRTNDASKTLKGDCKGRNPDKALCDGYEKKNARMKRACEIDALLRCAKSGEKPSILKGCTRPCQIDDKIVKDDCKGWNYGEKDDTYPYI